MPSNLPVRDPGYIDAEFREVPDENPLTRTIACPHCGKKAAPAFKMCFHCMQDLQPRKGFFEQFLATLFKK